MKITTFYLLLITFMLFCITEIHATGTWTRYEPTNNVNDVAVDGHYIWCSTNNGLVRWDSRDGSCFKISMDEIISRVSTYIGPELKAPVVVDGRGNNVFSGEHQVSFDGSDFQKLYDGVAKEIVFRSDGIMCTMSGSGGISFRAIDADRWGISLPFKGNSIDIDSSDNLWVARRITSDDPLGGIMRFDGEEYVHFGVGDGLISDEVSEIYVACDDILWFGGTDGICSFDGVNWQTFTNPELFGGAEIIDINQAPDSSLWVTDGVGIYNFESTLWSVHTPPASLFEPYGVVGIEYEDFDVDDQGVLWCPSKIGLLRYDGDTWSLWREEDGPIEWNHASVFLDSDNRKWFDEGRSISILDGETWSYDISPTHRFPLYQQSDKTLWAQGNEDKVWELSNEVWTLHSEVGEAGSFIEDHDNLLWAIGAKGISFYNGDSWQIFPIMDLFQNLRYAYSVVVTSDNIKWFRTDSGVISCKDQTWTLHTPTTRTIEYLLCDSLDRVWASTLRLTGRNEGVWCYENNTWINHASGGPQETIFCVELDQSDILWFGTLEGLWSYDGSIWIHHTDEDNSPEKVKMLMLNSDNSLWCFGYKDDIPGIWRYSNNTWTHFNKETTQGIYGISSMVVDENDVTWFATAGFDGIFSYTPDKVTQVDTSSGKPDAFPVISTYPNPFNPSTTIEFSLPEPGQVSLDIYNLAGQKVRTLVAESVNAGSHNVVWDGRDDAGKLLSSGIYFAGLGAGSLVKTAKMMLLR